MTSNTTFFPDFSPYYQAVQEFASNNFITRGCSFAAQKAYLAETAIGDGAAYCASTVYNLTLGNEGFFTTLSQAAGRQFIALSQQGGQFLYQHSPALPELLKDNFITQGLSSLTDFLTQAGAQAGSSARFASQTMGSHGSTLYSFLLGVGNKLQDLHNSGSFYKIFPLTLGTFFAYFGLKSLLRGTFGHNSFSARKKIVCRALYENQLSFSLRLSLIRDSFFGTMPGKLRAAILARSIANLAVATLLIYPLFVKSPPPNTDIDGVKNSEAFRAQTLEAAASLDERASDAQTLLVASQMYLSQKEQFNHAFSKAKMDPKVQCFVEEVLNPIPKNVSAAETLGGAQRAYHWASTKAAELTSPCTHFATFGHTTILNPSKSGLTQVNITHLKEACASRLSLINTSPKPLNTQLSDFAESICNSTLGYTPWANTCTDIRASLSKTVEEQRYIMRTGVITMCNALASRADLPLQLQTEFPKLPAKDASGYIDGLKARQNATPFIDQLTSNSDKLEELANQDGFGLQKYVQGFFNISDQPFELENIKSGYKNISLSVHPDKCPQELGDCTDLSSATNSLYQAFKKKPELIALCQKGPSSASDLFTISELFQRVRDSVNPFDFFNAGAPKDPSFKAKAPLETCFSQTYMNLMKKTCGSKG